MNQLHAKRSTIRYVRSFQSQTATMRETKKKKKPTQLRAISSRVLILNSMYFGDKEKETLTRVTLRSN